MPITPTPPRRSWFAVWRWIPTWVWLVAVPILFVGYFLSGVPLIYFLSKSQTTNKYVWKAAYYYNAIGRWCQMNSKLAEGIFLWEQKILERRFGPPKPVATPAALKKTPLRFSTINPASPQTIRQFVSDPDPTNPIIRRTWGESTPADALRPTNRSR